MSSLGKSAHKEEVARAGEMQAATVRTPRGGGNKNDLEADQGRTTARIEAMTGGALWRTQPMTTRWAQWDQENSGELQERLEAADITWSRGKPSFTVTIDGKVTMSWAQNQQVPMLVWTSSEATMTTSSRRRTRTAPTRCAYGSG